MPRLDVGLRAAAQSVINVTGTTITIRQITPGAYDVATSSYTSTEDDTEVKGLISEYDASELNDYVLVGDRKLIVSAADLDFTPTPKDRVVIDSAIYDVVRVFTVMAKDLPMTHEMQIRGAA